MSGDRADGGVTRWVKAHRWITPLASGAVIAVSSVVWRDDLGLLFGFIAVVFTFLALVAAAAAFLVTWPEYREWLRSREASVRVRLERAETSELTPDPVGTQATREGISRGRSNRRAAVRRSSKSFLPRSSH